MVRTIKRISHDLIPLSDAISELSSIISDLLSAVKPQAQFSSNKAFEYFNECVTASEKLALSARLVGVYLQEVDKEANRGGITID